MLNDKNIASFQAATGMPKSTGKFGASFLIRGVLALILLSFLFNMVNLRDIGRALSQLKPQFVLAALFLMLINYCLKTYRWGSILRIQRPDISIGRLLRYNFVIIFLGNLLPSSLAPDVVRIVYMSRRAVDPRTAISSIIADRILGNLSLAIVTLASILILKDTGLLPLGTLLAYVAGGFLVIAIAIPLLLRNPVGVVYLRRLLELVRKHKKFTSISEIYQQLRTYVIYPWILSKALMIAFVNLMLATLEFYLIAHSLSAYVPISYFLLFIPLVIFLSTLPVSLAGLGLLEASLVYFFTQIGMPLESCIASAVIFRALQLICLVPGAALYATDGFFAKELPA